MTPKQAPGSRPGDHGRPRAAHSTLSPIQLEQLRTALDAKKKELLRACEEHEAEAQESEAVEGDAADLAEGVIEDRQRAALDEHDRSILGEVERALAKMHAGTYGVSEKSGRPIPFARLRALPWTRYDLEDAGGKP